MKTDLTLHPAGKLEIPENTLAVITVPVYGGKWHLWHWNG